MAYSASERLAQIVSGIVQKYAPGIIRQAIKRDYPLWDIVMKKAKKTNTRKTYAKIQPFIPHSGRVADIGVDLSRGQPSSVGYNDIYLEKKRINSPLKILDEDIDELGDFQALEDFVTKYIADSMEGHMDSVRAHTLYDDKNKPGYLFKLKDTAGAKTKGTWIHIDVTPGVRRNVFPSHVVDVHQPGNSTADVSATVITDYDPDYAGGPAVTLNDAVTIPAGLILEIYGQGAYGKGIPDPLCALVDPSVATYLGLAHTVWRPTVTEWGGKLLTADVLVKQAIRQYKKKAKKLVAILDEVQMEVLVTDLKKSNFIWKEDVNLLGGYGGITLQCYKYGTLDIMQDDSWPIPTMVPIFDFDDIKLEYSGEGLAYIPDRGGTNAGGGHFILDTQYSNRLVGDIDSRVALFCEFRAKHGCVNSVDDTP